MEQRIWKFELEIADIQRIDMPEGAKILSIQLQNGRLCLWALVARFASPEIREIEIIGTGNPIMPLEDGLKREFIGTVQQGQFVWHIFELK
jgi:hypothetical protein